MSKPAQNSDKLGTERIGKLIWTYSLPAITGTVVMALYNIVDRIYLGHGVGHLAISGLALTFPFMSILMAFGMLVGAGASTRISIALGEKDKEKAELILGNALILTLIISGFAVIISYIFMSDLLRLFGATDNIIQYAEDYMRIIIPFGSLSALTFGFNNIMRASGYPQKAMWTMIISAITNIVLTPIFIFSLNMGIQGAAWSTNISLAISVCWVMSHYFRKESNIRFKRENFKLNADIVKSILGIGLSPFSMQLATSLIIVIINIQLLYYGGELAVGALGIVNSILVLIIMILIGLNQGVQPIWGYNYGAKNFDRMFHTLRTTVIIATVISTTGFILATFMPHLMARMFTANVEMIEVAAKALRISAIFFPIIGFQIVVSSFFQSIGKAKISIFLSMTRQFLFLIPCLFIFPPIFGLNGVWMSLPVSDGIAVVVTAITLWFFIRKFKRENSF